MILEILESDIRAIALLYCRYYARYYTYYYGGYFADAFAWDYALK